MSQQPRAAGGPLEGGDRTPAQLNFLNDGGPQSWDLPRPFTVEVEVRPEDIDSYDHVNNAVYLRWLDRVAWAHAEAVGAGEQTHVEMRRGMAAHKTELRYVAPAMPGDRLLVGNWIVYADGRLRVHRRFQIVRPSDNATLMRALGMYVCIDLDSGRPCRMPPLYVRSYVVLPEVREVLLANGSPFDLKR